MAKRRGPIITSKVNSRIRKLEDIFNLTDKEMKGLVRKMDMEFRKHERRLFATQGSSGGKRWKRLSPRYAKQKRKKYPGRKILVRKGDLRKGLTQKGGDHIAEYSKIGRHFRIKLGVSNRVARFVKEQGRNPFQMTKPQRRRYYGIALDLFQKKLARARRVLRAGRRVRSV